MRVCPRCNAIFKAQVVSCSGDGTTLIDRNDDPHLSSPLGRFILEAVLAEGVTGRIYRSGDAAVRVLYGDFGTQELVIKRMFRDVEAAKELQHPNVARILDAGSDDGSTWIAWELARGQTLETLVAAEPSMSGERVGSMCAQIAAALAEAHEADILHKNLSPTNVMVVPKGKRDAIKVLDFGLGSLSRSSQAVRFRSGRDYAALEALKPSGASKAADVYSLGLIASELIAKTGDGAGELGSLVSAMIDPDPKKRPQSGREVLSRLDEIGFTPIVLAKREEAAILSEDLEQELQNDGLVLLGAEGPEIVELTQRSASPAPTTTYVYAGGASQTEPTAIEEIDIEESRRKLGFIETSRPRSDSKPKEAAKKSLLPRGPVVEKIRTPPNGVAPLEELPRIGEAVHTPIEVTDSQMIGEVEMIDSQDLEMISGEPDSDTDEQPIPLPGVLFDPAERIPTEAGIAPPVHHTPGPTLLSAAELSSSKAIGGVQSLPVEYGERTRPVQRENPGGFRPRGSWPTEDLVLPAKHGGEDPRRVPTAIIRTRGPFGEVDVPPDILSGRETEITRARNPTALLSPDLLPIDRSPLVIDPAEGAVNISGEILVRPRRSIIPLAVGLAILTVAAAAVAIPNLDDEVVSKPVQIEALPDEPLEAALPEGDAEEKEPEVAEPVVAKTERPSRIVEKAEPKIEDEPEEVEEERAPPPRKPKKQVKKKQVRRRANARPEPKAEPKKEQPEKLEKGTLIDPFAE